MEYTTIAKHDGERLYKEWRDRHGVKLEYTTMRIILQSLVSVYSKDREDTDWCIETAIRKAILFAWEAGWAAAGGDDDA